MQEILAVYIITYALASARTQAYTQAHNTIKVIMLFQLIYSSFARFVPYALNQRSPAEGKGKGQKPLAHSWTTCESSVNLYLKIDAYP